MTKPVIADFKAFQQRQIPLRSEMAASEPARFVIQRSKGSHSPFQWLYLWMWNIPLVTWTLEDSDPFWLEWFDFLEQVAGAQLPAGTTYTNAQIQKFEQEMVSRGEIAAEDADSKWGYSFHAAPLADPRLFHLTIHEVDDTNDDFQLVDEVLDRLQFVGAFTGVFEQFLAKDYEVVESAEGERFDLNNLPWKRLKDRLKI